MESHHRENRYRKSSESQPDLFIHGLDLFLSCSFPVSSCYPVLRKLHNVRAAADSLMPSAVLSRFCTVTVLYQEHS